MFQQPEEKNKTCPLPLKQLLSERKNKGMYATYDHRNALMQLSPGCHGWGEKLDSMLLWRWVWVCDWKGFLGEVASESDRKYLDWEWKTILGNGRWAHVPRGGTVRAVVFERLVMPFAGDSGVVRIWQGVAGVCLLAWICKIFSPTGEHHCWDFNGRYSFSEKVYGKMSNGLKKELKHSHNKWGVGGKRDSSGKHRRS